MATGICWLDERDVETDFALTVTALDGWPGGLGSAPRELNPIEGPEMSGALLDPRLLRRAATRATISGILDAGSMATSRLKLDALAAALGQGEVRIRTVFAPDRHCLATLDQAAGEPEAVGIVNGAFRVQLGFLVKDGVAWRVTEDGYALGTTRVACPIGSAPSYPLITIHGGGASLTNPVVTVRNAAGDIFQQMGFTVVLPSTDYLLVDTARALVSRSASGTISDGISLWTLGDFPILRPADGWLEDGASPTVELGMSAGIPSGVIMYRRAYR